MKNDHKEGGSRGTPEMGSETDLDEQAFVDHLSKAAADLQTKQERLRQLRAADRLILYGFGTRGQALARQLTAAGIHTVIHDSNPEARGAAAAAGYEVAATVPENLPLVIAAAQNQMVLLRRYPRAYSLVECLHALNQVNQCAPAPEFSAVIGEHARDLYAVYQALDVESRKAFLHVLRFRASLDVFCLEGVRQPLEAMWRLPIPQVRIESLCDGGAYDGDTVRALAPLTALRRVLAIEPNPALQAKIAESAGRFGIELHSYGGGLWSRRTRLKATELLGGMVAVEEDPEGDIPADALDNIAEDPYDYVKFDVEGAEEMAMDGARRVLAEASVVALAAYHRPADIFRLPQRLLELKGGAGSLHFAHYSECFDDSIFYHF